MALHLVKYYEDESRAKKGTANRCFLTHVTGSGQANGSMPVHEVYSSLAFCKPKGQMSDIKQYLGFTF